jgi:hypothetical protein
MRRKQCCCSTVRKQHSRQKPETSGRQRIQFYASHSKQIAFYVNSKSTHISDWKVNNKAIKRSKPADYLASSGQTSAKISNGNPYSENHFRMTKHISLLEFGFSGFGGSGVRWTCSI